MLVIRNEQMRVFKVAAREQFVQALIEYVRAQWPARAAGRSSLDLEPLVLRVIRLAESFGLATESDIRAFVDIYFLCGQDLDEPETRWIVAWLSDSKVPNPSERVNRVLSEVQARRRVEAANQQLREAWANGQ